MFEFQEWPKIPRFNRTVFISEKIDGKSCGVALFPLETAQERDIAQADPYVLSIDYTGVGTGAHFGTALLAGSRSRWLRPEGLGPKGCDESGFAAWVLANGIELQKLGPGRHYGEWWGAGIGRRYGRTEKRFSLFNTARWGEHNPPPACCSVVPILYRGTPDGIDAAVSNLRLQGSRAAPGFMKPEGVIVYHTASRQYYKITLDNDDVPKGKIVQSGNVVGGDLAGGDIYKVVAAHAAKSVADSAVKRSAAHVWPGANLGDVMRHEVSEARFSNDPTESWPGPLEPGCY